MRIKSSKSSQAHTQRGKSQRFLDRLDPLTEPALRSELNQARKRSEFVRTSEWGCESADRRNSVEGRVVISLHNCQPSPQPRYPRLAAPVFGVCRVFPSFWTRNFLRVSGPSEANMLSGPGRQGLDICTKSLSRACECGVGGKRMRAPTRRQIVPGVKTRISVFAMAKTSSSRDTRHERGVV